MEVIVDDARLYRIERRKFQMRHRYVEVAVGADVLTENLPEEPTTKAAVALCGEKRIVGLLDLVVGIGVAAEMGIAQVELRCPWQGREFIPRLDIPCGSPDLTINRIISLQDELTV